MIKFKFSTPYISPKGYKGKDAKVESKWFIRYKIAYEEEPKYLKDKSLIQHPKIYGGEYNREINQPKTHGEKVENAEVLLARVLDDLQKGIDPKNRKADLTEKLKLELQEAHQYRVQYVFDEWFASKNYVNPIPSKVISADKYKGFWQNQFIPLLKSLGKDHDIRKVTHDDINDWILSNYNADKWVAKTIEVKIGLLSGVFKFAFKKKYIKENPMVYVSPIKENKVVVKNGVSSVAKKKEARFNILTEHEQELIYETLDLKNEAIAKTLGFAFIRFTEIFRLRLEYLDTVNWVFNIPASIAKGQRKGETATVKIYPKLQEVLKRYLAEYFGDDIQPDYYLFYHDTKTSPSSYSMFQHYFNATKDVVLREKEVAIKKSPYCFKHTGAKSFIDQNKAKSKTAYQIIEAIMKMMRHSNFNTSQKYIYVDLGINLDANDDFTFD